MNKRGSWWLWISLGLLVLLIIIIFLYFVLYNSNNSGLYKERVSSGALKNPTDNKTVAEAVSDFNDAYVYYLLYSIKAYNLRDVPLTSNHPRIRILLEDSNYSAIIDSGQIKIVSSLADNEDIKIFSTKEELVSMLKDESYVPTSFKNGRSRIELVADKTTLFAKGYLNMYNELTGKGITGGVIGIYSD